MNLGDISTFAKERVVKATLKENLILALGEQNINTQITNTKVELSEEFKKTYDAIKSDESERTIVIANAEKILDNMREQFKNNFKTIRDFENEGRE